MKTLFQNIAIGCLIIGSVSCSKNDDKLTVHSTNTEIKQQTAQTLSTVAKAEQSEESLFGKWYLTKLVNTKNTLSNTDKSSFYVVFNEDGTFTGKTSTNEMLGEYMMLKSQMIDFDVALTKVIETNEMGNQFSDAFFQTQNNIEYTLQQGVLTLNMNNSILYFKR